GQPRQLTFDAGYAMGATWTTDSREIVFASPRDPAQGSLWRIPVAGGSPRPVSPGLRETDYPSMSRGGGRIAFVNSWTDNNIHLRVGSGFPRAGTPWRWDAPRGVAVSTGTDHSPSFSPDGERFAFTSDRNTESGKQGGNNQIWVSRRDGSEARQL